MQLEITQEIIDQARALRRISLEQGHIPLVWTCPIALAARALFSRPCFTTQTFLGVCDENGDLTKWYFHEGARFVYLFDTGRPIKPTTITFNR